MPELRRIELLDNPAYEKSGLKSYVYLLQKYDINPTLHGPYQSASKVESQEKHNASARGRRRIRGGHLQKTDAKGSHAGNVTGRDIQLDSYYLCPVSFGSPPQTLMMDFDTGSSDTWVWSTDLPSNIQHAGRKSGHTIFDRTKSSTFRKLPGATWNITYGDGGGASGGVGTDNVTFGGLCVKNQAVELASKMSEDLISNAGDGLVGLAFGRINTVKPEIVKTVVDNMILQDDIPEAQELFTAHLGSWKDSKAGYEGRTFYTFGYIDKQALQNAHVQTPFYTPVDSSNGFWEVQSECVKVGDAVIQRPYNRAIIDTGTTLAVLDDNTLAQIYAQIPGAYYDSDQQGWLFPSDLTSAQLPVVQFAIGSQLFALHKENLGFQDLGNGYTYGGCQSRGDFDFDILGDTFLKSIYAIFDQGNLQFGAVQRPEVVEYNSSTDSTQNEL